SRGASGPLQEDQGCGPPRSSHDSGSLHWGTCALPRAGEVKWLDEPPERGRINRSLWAIVLCVPPVLNGPPAAAGQAPTTAAGPDISEGRNLCGGFRPFFVHRRSVVRESEAEPGPVGFGRPEVDPANGVHRHDHLLR